MTLRQVFVPFTAALLGKIQEVAAVHMKADQEIEKLLAETEGGISLDDMNLVTDVDPLFKLGENKTELANVSAKFCSTQDAIDGKFGCGPRPRPRPRPRPQP